MSVNTAFWHPREQTADCRAHRGDNSGKVEKLRRSVQWYVCKNHCLIWRKKHLTVFLSQRAIVV